MKISYFTAFAVGLFLSTCGGAETSIPIIHTTPLLPTPTFTTQYIHYMPTAASNIHLEFEYPSSWIFNENLQDSGFMIIDLGDPQFLSLPAPSSDDLHPTPNDFGDISIFITHNKPEQTANTVLESYKQAYKNEIHRKMIKDYKIKIDGYNATVLECRLDPLEPYTSFMIERRTFFIVQDQIYEIIFTIAEKDQGGEFEKGYEHFLDSLKITH